MIAISPLIVFDSNEVVKTKKATFTYSRTNAASYFWNSPLAPLNWTCLHFKDFTRLKTWVNATISQLQIKKEDSLHLLFIWISLTAFPDICLTQAVKDGRLSQIKTTSEFKCFCLFSQAKRTNFPSKMEFFLLLAKFQSCLKTCLFGTEFSYPVWLCWFFCWFIFCYYFFKVLQDVHRKDTQ